MKARRWTEITVETHELTVVRVNRRQAMTALCEACQAEVWHLSIAGAAAALKISETAIFRLVEGEEIHWTETADGRLLLCSDSLSAWEAARGGSFRAGVSRTQLSIGD